MTTSSVPSQSASLRSARSLASTLEKARERRCGAPALDAANQRLLDTFVLIQPEKAVRTEVDDVSPLHAHLAVRTHVIGNEILQVGAVELPGEVFDEAHEPMLPHRLGQLCHGALRHPWCLFEHRLDFL